MTLISRTKLNSNGKRVKIINQRIRQQIRSRNIRNANQIMLKLRRNLGSITTFFEINEESYYEIQRIQSISEYIENNTINNNINNNNNNNNNTTIQKRNNTLPSIKSILSNEINLNINEHKFQVPIIPLLIPEIN